LRHEGSLVAPAAAAAAAAVGGSDSSPYAVSKEEIMLFVRNQLSLLAVEASTRLGCMLGRLCMLIEMGATATAMLL
jgi:hypothetical protein